MDASKSFFYPLVNMTSSIFMPSSLAYALPDLGCMLSNTSTYKRRKWYALLVLSTLDFRLLSAKLWVWWQMFTTSCSKCEVSSLWPSAGSNPLFTWPHPTFTQLKVYAIQHKVGFAQQGTCACLVPCRSQAVINPCKARIP